MLSLFKLTNPVSSMTGESMFVAAVSTSPVKFIPLKSQSPVDHIKKKVHGCICNSELVDIIRDFVFTRPFRRVTDKGALLWDRIHKLEKGQIYKQVRWQETVKSC